MDVQQPLAGDKASPSPSLVHTQQPPAWEQASQSPGLVVEVPRQKLAVEKKRRTGGDCEIIAIPAKKSRGRKQPKLKKVKVEEDEGSLRNWIDEECVVLIDLRREMEQELSKNAKKQGDFFIVLKCLSLFSRNLLWVCYYVF
jgi:hypothetical protein